MIQAKSKLWLAVGCLSVGVCSGAVGAQVVAQALTPSYLNTGLFSLGARHAAQFSVTLDDDRAGGSARVLLQFIDRAGKVAAERRTVVAAGQSASLEIGGAGQYRAHAEVLDAPSLLTARRRIVGSVQMLDLTTEEPDGWTCSIFDPGGAGAGRQ